MYPGSVGPRVLTEVEAFLTRFNNKREIMDEMEGALLDNK